MSDERGDLILEMLPAIRAEQEAQREKLDEIVVRLGRLEGEATSLHGDFAGLSVRLGNLDRRVGRIERQLELAEAPATRLNLAFPRDILA